MIILVDYDNILKQDRSPGLVYVTDRILQAIGPTAFTPNERARFRLYGGWYKGDLLTRNAQDLSAEIAGNFSRPATVSDKTATRLITVAAEMALSLEVSPAKHLVHTYRPRNRPSGIGFADPISRVHCPSTTCGLLPLREAINRDQCPMAGCTTKPSDLLTRDEQKLVDTMLISDLIFLAHMGEKTIAIVSSDDDMWPGIETALALRASIVRIHTRPKALASTTYLAGVGPQYVQRGL